jgi:organic hydroperoxide reductase OsmC/OhrA
MPDIETETTSTEGFATTSNIGDWDLTVDATGEEGPDPNQVLVADYAACFIPAFRVGAERAGYDDVGKVKIDAGADLDENDDLEAIDFELFVEEALGDDASDILLRAERICHVHAALREELQAEVTVRDGVDF